MSAQCVLVTTTFFKSLIDLRFKLALKTVETARSCGYPIIVVDGSPDPEFRSIFSANGATVCRQGEPGTAESRRQTIRTGLNRNWNGGTADVIVWIEPEKHPLVPLLKPLIQAVAAGTSDLVIPQRRTLDSYPPYQAASERLANLALGAITGRPDLDLYIGPRVMNREMAKLFLDYDRRYGDNWEIIFIPVLSALAQGKRVHSQTVDYVHPAEQTAAEATPEMDRKRDRQRVDIISAMARAAQAMGFYFPLAEV